MAVQFGTKWVHYYWTKKNENLQTGFFMSPEKPKIVDSFNFFKGRFPGKTVGYKKFSWWYNSVQKEYYQMASLKFWFRVVSFFVSLEAPTGKLIFRETVKVQNFFLVVHFGTKLVLSGTIIELQCVRCGVYNMTLEAPTMIRFSRKTVGYKNIFWWYSAF